MSMTRAVEASTQAISPGSAHSKVLMTGTNVGCGVLTINHSRLFRVESRDDRSRGIVSNVEHLLKILTRKFGGCSGGGKKSRMNGIALALLHKFDGPNADC